MPAAGDNIHYVAFLKINDPVIFINTAAPISLHIPAQRLRLSYTFERITLYIINYRVYSP